METEIKLVQVPKIVHKLQEVGASVTKRLNELNINNLIATEGTMKTLKELRAELNKELSDFEEQRKFIKNGVLNPYNEFELIYKTEISEKYKGAIDLLKDKICSVELKIKDEKKAKVKSYFDELCLSEKIDFITFDQIGWDINLSTSEKAYKEKCSEFVYKTIDDLNLIKTTEFEAEILTEYKSSLNVSQAITTVNIRKQREKEETARIHQVEVNRRISRAKFAGMIFDEFTGIYCFNDEIFITSSFIDVSSNEEWLKKIVECEEKIKAEKQSGTLEFTAPITKPTVISAPVVKEKEETVTASFEVTGTMAQLRLLSQFLKTNNITYKNI